MVTIYRSTDTDAPQMPADSSGSGRQDFFLDLLKACLVNGYGSKSAAGWSIDYEDTTAQKRRLGLSNGNGVAEFVTWGTYSLGAFLWDSITTPGVGAIYTDTWESVVSEGVNGWRDEQLEAPGSESDYSMGVNCYGIYSGYSTATAWTVYADDKSAWVLFHYPDGDSNAEPGDSISKGTYHPQLFIGALKSPDLGRADQGNMFIGFGNRAAPTSANCTGGSNGALSYLWGLRTPAGDLPASGNGSDYGWIRWELATGYLGNSRASLRLIQPMVIYYRGNDAPMPTGFVQSYSYFPFATLPGVGHFSSEGGGAYNDFWAFYTAENSSTWNLEPHTFGGVQWMPWTLYNTGTLNNVGITDDAGWWA